MNQCSECVWWQSDCWMSPSATFSCLKHVSLPWSWMHFRLHIGPCKLANYLLSSLWRGIWQESISTLACLVNCHILLGGSSFLFSSIHKVGLPAEFTPWKYYTGYSIVKWWKKSRGGRISIVEWTNDWIPFLLCYIKHS